MHLEKIAFGIDEMGAYFRPIMRSEVQKTRPLGQRFGVFHGLVSQYIYLAELV